MQLKYSNYAAFSHVHGVAVNNSGLIVKRIKILEILPVNHLVGWYVVECEDGERLKLRSFEPNKLLVSVGDIGILGYRGQTIQTFNREGVRKRNF